jgi:hypothetical protein|tara:strand:- start:1309 stop:2031 length:723 start_codon:yes stop_codon:yes gene_type:complete
MTDEEQLKRDGFYLSTPEYALMLNISTEALRSRRRRGELEGEYKSDGKKYWWKSVRPNTVKELRNNRLKVSSSVSRVSRARRRGAHRTGQETRYTNQSFKYANELKMLNRIKSEVPETVINEINPEVIKVAQDNLLKRREKQLKETWRPTKNYGGMIRGHELAFEYDKENRRRDTSFYLNSAARDGRGGAYNINEPDDPGSVEIEPRELGPGDTNIERQPISKVQESILRLELEELKKNK